MFLHTLIAPDKRLDHYIFQMPHSSMRLKQYDAHEFCFLNHD